MKIGILGYGNMGAAMAERMRKISYNFRKVKIRVYDKDTEKTKNVPAGIAVADNIRDLVQSLDTVILAVKPQDFDRVLSEIKDIANGRLFISIAAGITTTYIERILGNVEIVRVMPNLPSKIGEGMIGLCKGRFASQSVLELAADLFWSLGQVITTEEKMMNAVTAVSGSGPAYVCEFLESRQFTPDNISRGAKQLFLSEFQKAAEGVGFNRKTAASLVKTTFSGTIRYLKKNKILPLDLKKQVASKGGTTEAALEVLHNGGTLSEAVKAALKRAEELSKG